MKYIYIYGAGRDGVNFVRLNKNKYEIKGFIDGNKDYWGQCVSGLKVFSPEVLKSDKSDFHIMVTSTYYWKDMIENLKNMGFSHDNYTVITNEKNDVETVDRFVNHNQKWMREFCRESENKILMVYSYVPVIDLISRSVLSNILAKKYNAEIIGCRWDFDRIGYESDSLWRAYSSFNTKSVIEEILDDNQKEYANILVNEILESKKSRHSYSEIEIYGIDFSTEIIGDYLRGVNPIIDIKDASFINHIKMMVCHVVFWHDYFAENNHIKAVVLQDGIYREGIIRKIATIHKIPVYAANITGVRRLDFVASDMYSYKYYNSFFLSMSSANQKKGLEIGKKLLEERFGGSDWDLGRHENVFNFSSNKRILNVNDKTKVMIFPHVFEEDAFPCGEMIFDDHWEWLCTLGELSKLTDYDWYIKSHPDGGEISKKVIEVFHKKYPNITIVDTKVSPMQLKNEGLNFAFTIYGSIGHEYPALGINVIEAGNSPHISFDFCCIPKSKDEFRDIVLNIEKARKDVKLEELYRFYYLEFYAYLGKNRNMCMDLYGNSKLNDVWMLDHPKEAMEIFLDEYSKERHDHIITFLENVLAETDSRRVYEFWQK